MAHTKMYNPGVIKLDLPRTNYFYELPLFSVNDFHGGFSVTLVLNYDAKKNTNDHFNMIAGYKLNVQKRLLLTDGVPCEYIDTQYKTISFSNYTVAYTFQDDSQRILRENSAGDYIIEYPDGSTEIFDSDGYITSVLDKYGNTVLTYTYDASHKITLLTYRSEKEIAFSYNSSNKINAITYAGNTISFSYTATDMNITLFSGEYIRLQSNGYNFLSTVVDKSNTNTQIPKNAIYIIGTLDGEYVTEATLTKRIYDTDGNATETWNTTYNFPNLNYPDHSYNQVDITDYYGARKRIQYLNDKPQYSYEIRENDVEFISYGTTYVYPSNVEILSKDESTSQTSVVGTQGIINGAKMRNFPIFPNIFQTNLSEHFDQIVGFYLLTGWLKKDVENPIYSAGADNCEIIVTNASISTVHLQIDPTPVNNWKYFSSLVYCSHDAIEVAPSSSSDIHLKDLRITKISNPGEKNSFLTSSDGLMPHQTPNAEHDFFIPLSECTFYFNDVQIADNIYYDDILKYKINKHDDTYPFEFYTEKVTCVFEKGSEDQITVKYPKDGTQKSFNIDDCYIAKRVVTQKNETVYQYLWHDAIGALRFRTVDESGNLLFVQRLDSHFNTEQNTILIGDSGRCICYERSETGLVTSEIVSDTDSNPLYTRTYAYSADTSGNPTLTVTDEFNAQTVYTYDAVWGRPISVTLPDGTVVTDVYDDSMRALLGRTVGGTGGRTNQLGYTDGLLSAMQTGDLSYSFAYTNDKLTGVSRQGVSIEEYEHTKDSTSAYYPSKANTSYGITENYDKYGRLTYVEGVINNVYGTLASLTDTSITETTLNPVVEIVNSASVLATATDMVAKETASYKYNAKNKQVVNRTVTNSTDNSVKCTETFTYDNENRLASHATQHNTPTVFSVKGTVNYVSHISAIDTSSKVGEYNYYINYHINNSLASQTVNSYDLYDRKNTKKVYFSNNRHLTVGYEFDKTRVSKCSNTITESTITESTIDLHTVEYSYDSLGRIFCEHIVGNDTCTNYTYDAYGQLVRENNATYGNTFTYTYDAYGNITQVKRYAYTRDSLEGMNSTTFSYVYGDTAKDRLTAFNGNTISYNTYGYISSYKGAAYSWNKGRLASIQKGNPRLTTGDYEYCGFTYNGYGQRTAKNYIYNSNTVILGSPHPTYNTKYWYDGSGRLIREYCTQTYKNSTTVDTHELIYLYDDEGMVGVSYSYKGATPQNYFYVRNLHGDVVAIYSENGIKQAEYAYDAYGNCKVTNSTNYNLAYYNPIRYRGYYYDRETGLYYLNARYYNPEWRRFLSHDLSAYLDPESVNGLNLYAYCGNDPVNRFDPTGHDWEWSTFWTGLFMAGTAITAIALSVTTFGAGIPLAMSIVAGVTLGAGVLTGINGVATMIEAGTDYNFVRDGLFNDVLGLSDSAYNVYAGITEGVAAVGSMILGFYHTTGQYKAAKASQQYLGKGYTKAGKNRWVSADGYRQVRWDTTRHMYKGKPSPVHFNWYEYQYPIAPGVRNKLVSDVHVWLKWFSYYM